MKTPLKEEMRRTGHILEVSEAEWRRILLDIHDGPVQCMYAALAQIEALQKKLASARTRPDPETVRHGLRQISGLIETALWEIRNFIGAFRPPEFRERDLVTVLKTLIAQHEELTGCQVELEIVSPIPDVAVPVKIALYRILQEALSNAYRHAGTQQQFVRIYPKAHGVVLEVRDEGTGFDVHQVLAAAQEAEARHIGLRGMQERAELVGGQMTIQSRPGHGTRITVWVPCDDATAD